MECLLKTKCMYDLVRGGTRSFLSPLLDRVPPRETVFVLCAFSFPNAETICGVGLCVLLR